MRWISYDENGNIWGYGDSPEDAVHDSAGYLSEIRVPEDLDTIEVTGRLALAIERHGWDIAHPGFRWHIVSGNIADLDED